LGQYRHQKSQPAHFGKAELLSMRFGTSKWPKFCNDFCRFRAHVHGSEPRVHGERWMNVMKNDGSGSFGIIVGGVVAAIALIFILSGGELGGKKTVEGDQDLPPVATTDK
jgi:hypothetical protein